MPDDTPISRESFDERASHLGIAGSPSHMDELYEQVQGVLRGTDSLLSIDVSGTEPDMAFKPSGGA